MNDFLHSLRTGKDKRYDRTRRGNENAPFRTNDRHNSLDKKKHANFTKSNVAENAYVTIAKLLPPVKNLLETIVTDNKEYLGLEERKAAAMETIAFYLKKLAGAEESESIDSPEEGTDEPESIMVSEKAADVPTSGDTVAEDLIRDMREQGFSYDKIARQLDMQHIPTPSGRGKWRGQAVSKLLKK